MRARVEKAFEHFIDRQYSHDKRGRVAHARSRKMDIAVDLKGFTKKARPGIFALRPAPIQVNYLGFPGTMGASYIDYLIADRIVVPARRTGALFRELVYLPDCYQCNDTKRSIAARTPTRAEAGLPENRFRLLLVQQQLQDHAGRLRRLDAAARRIEGSVLWILESNAAAAQNLRRGGGASRFSASVVFAPKAQYAEHLARIGLPICSWTPFRAALIRRRPMLYGPAFRC